MVAEIDPEEAYRRLIHEAPLIPGDSGDRCESQEIEWLDPKLIKEGQDFIQRNFFSISLAHIGALLYGFSFKSLTSVLLRTGGFGLGDATKSMLRHIETEIHIQKWYSSDILSPTAEAFKDIQHVRKLHFSALRRSERTDITHEEDIPGKEEKLELIAAIKKDLDHCCDTSEAPQHLLTYYPTLFMSQYDMVMTQFGFFAVIFLFPDSLGIRDTKGLDGFLHLWAVLGRMLGIEDRFNLALKPSRELCLKLFKNLGMASLKDMDLTILHLQQTYSDALAMMLPCTSLKANYYFGLSNMKRALPEFVGDNVYAVMSWRDKLFCGLMKLATFLVYHFDFVRRHLNGSIVKVMVRNQARMFGRTSNNNEGGGYGKRSG